MNKDICVICEVEIENEDDCSTLTEKGKHLCTNIVTFRQASIANSKKFGGVI